jgi:predicted phosphoribosyltransferase
MEGKTVIVVDDGIATGLTMRVSVMMLRKQHPKKIIVAVPVAPPTSVDIIKQVADEVIVLHTSVDFSGVGQFYEDFSEVTDAEVMEVMSDKLASPQAGDQ